MLKLHFHNLWFRDRDEEIIFIKSQAVRMRAGILLLVPIYTLLVLFTTVFGASWQVWDGSSMEESFEVSQNFNVLYEALVYRTTYDYTIPTLVLFYALFEMIAGMFVRTSYLSPTLHLATFLTRNTPPKWEPLKPKRFAWTIGGTMIAACLLFFNPDSFAVALNSTLSANVLPTDRNYMPDFIPTMVWFCFGLMWLEATFGFCLGCKLHWILAKLRIFKQECYSCSNVDFAEMQYQAELKRQIEALNNLNEETSEKSVSS